MKLLRLKLGSLSWAIFTVQKLREFLPIMFGQHRAVHLDSEVGPFTFYHLTVFSSQNFLTDQTPGQAADWFLRPEESVLGGSEKLNHLDISDLRSSLERE